MEKEIRLSGGKQTTFKTQEVAYSFRVNDIQKAVGKLIEYNAFIQDLHNAEVKHEIKTYKTMDGKWFNFDPFIDMGDPVLIRDFRDKIDEFNL